MSRLIVISNRVRRRRPEGGASQGGLAMRSRRRFVNIRASGLDGVAVNAAICLKNSTLNASTG